MKHLKPFGKVISYLVFLLGTHQNLQGFNMFSSLLAYKILEDQIDELEEKRFLGMQGDAAYLSNMRITQAGAVLGYYQE